MVDMSSTPRQTETVNLRPGDLVGAYRIERKLGSGGMADVYYAVHQGLERPAALKILRPSLATDATHLQRFMQEARAAASLVHPNIVQVYDVGQAGELRYIAQEYIPGSNLRHYLATHQLRNQSGQEQSLSGSLPQVGEPRQKSDRQLAIREALSILLQILAALNKSASSGIVHRDIKPENIMLTQDGDVKVADFGLARILYGDDPQLTRAGTTLGTPMYMSPEQIQEGEVDIRSDLYSLGVTLYHMLTGRPPFTGETPLALAMQHVQATVPEMSDFREAIPNSLDELVKRLLKKSPSERFDSPREVLDYLRGQRDKDLIDDWPDQTVPLPGATAATGPLQATLQLQSRLRKAKHRSAKRFVKLVGAVCLLGGAFLAGNLLTFSSPQRLLEVDALAEPTIEQLGSVKQQYRWALLDTGANRIDKWRAVERYFPRDEDPFNRYYGDLAKLQLARVYQESSDGPKAERELQDIVNINSPSQNVVKARAWLQLASLYEEKQNEAAMSNAVRQAKGIRDSEIFNVKDREQLNAAVRQMSGNLPMLWLDQ